MTTKHTPGPWTIEADADKAGRHPLHDNRHVVAPDGVVCDLRDQPAQAADARLIAAAPDLLAALMALWPIACRIQHDDQTPAAAASGWRSPRGAATMAALSLAAAAITKAQQGAGVWS